MERLDGVKRLNSRPRNDCIIVLDGCDPIYKKRNGLVLGKKALDHSRTDKIVRLCFCLPLSCS